MYRFSFDTPIGRVNIYEDDGKIKRIDTRDYEKPECKEMLTPVIEEAYRQLCEYFLGERTCFDIPIALEGTPFQKTVWAELRKINYGDTATYGEIAKRIGKPNAARAVGGANNKNPILIITPCHRVIGANGSLTGFACGIDIKRKLLDIERSNKERLEK